jgi:hypothetical protein
MNRTDLQAPPITQLEMSEADIAEAQRMAAHLGYEQAAYTSSSALWGLFCLPENPARNPKGLPTRGGCIILTAEFGLLFVQDKEDVHLYD